MHKCGVEFITVGKQKQLEIRQNILVKYAIGLGKYTETTPLFRSLRLESIQGLYRKHKLFFYKQLHNNELTLELFNFLKEYYMDNNPPKASYVAQLGAVEAHIGMTIENTKLSLTETCAAVDAKYACQDESRLDTLRFRFYLMSKKNTTFEQLTALMSLVRNSLYVDFGYNN